MKTNMKKTMLHYLMKVKYYILIGTILMPLSIYFKIQAPIVVGKILNELLKEGVGIVNYPEFWKDVKLFLYYLLLFAVLKFASELILAYGANKSVVYIQNDLFKKVLRFPVSYFDKEPAGSISSRVGNDPAQLKEFFETSISYIIVPFLTILAILYKIVILEPRLLIPLILPMPILAIGNYIYAKIMRDASFKVRQYVSEINSTFNETIGTIDVIRSFNGKYKKKKEFDNLNANAFKEDRRLSLLAAYLGFNFSDTMKNLTLSLVIIYFGIGTLRGEDFANVGMIYIFINYTTQFFDNINNTMMSIGGFQRSMAAAEHAFNMFEVDLPLEDLSDNGINLKGDVEFKDVDFSYVEGEQVLHSLSVKVGEGQSVGIVGRTGAGKSSLMNLLFRFYDPDRGEITIGSKDICKMSLRDLRKNMSIVIQDPFLFMGTIETNVSLNTPGIDEKMVEDALIKVGASDFVSKLENGIKTTVTEKGMTYSLGERQLISFARALVHNPKILVLDEATASIDSETESLIQNAIKTIQEGRTTFIIAHRLSTIMNCDKIIVLDKGRIVEEGTHEELLKLNGIYNEMWLKSLEEKCS
ncbi:ABC transporter ATP-binding protein [Peptoniphilus sp. BV3AC2]|uniref:ABC transporter ATP-binding protein n=1 Tax=Peptoniphilus sp. BV3AC2 TaxID=1111133 RepID=UPI0003B83A30|nr:ABC transporter ATP-binding protein [Peptoniphilus sp. BV3AC2]ERT63250.1 putative multidrug resistance ABC transporter ATP-binding/permease protein YheH [Peptoniphilus sp. BV3AC2]